ncbi:MAG: DUF5655 domain-containing protein [Candidatus Omnitrophica bacterium]|nr:DUF5655 domain-containing protein [Candidatus Omnitrophota bacterium]
MTHGGAPDTLGIDKNGFPVIIEYKKKEDENIINQGLFYLFWILDHPSELEKLVREKGIKDEIQFLEPRLICIAQGYNKYDAFAVKLINDLVGIPIIELWEYNLHEDDSISLEKKDLPMISVALKPSKRIKIETQRKVKIPTQTYNIEYHFKKANEDTKKIFFELRKRILTLDEDMVEVPTKYQIGYRSAKVFTSIYIQKKAIRIFIDADLKKFDDPKKIAYQIKWDPPTNFLIKSFKQEELDYAMYLINQAYKFTK